MKGLFSIVFALLSCTVSQAETTPLRRANQLLKAKSEEFVKVEGTRVLLADYPLIKKDFPHLKDLSNEKIDEWLVEQVSYIASPQADQENVNTYIPKNLNNKKVVYRPKDYGRASVIPVKGGLMDAKGTGALKPSSEESRNGLLTLGEAFREFLYEKLVTKIFKEKNPRVKTVGCYAVLDYGFNIKWPNQSQARAGMLLRQAHVRVDTPFSLLPADQMVGVEKTLRKFGISSAGAHRHLPFDLLNVQGADSKDPNVDATLVDFGAYLTLPDHELNARPAFSIEEWLRKHETSDASKLKLLMDPQHNSSDFTPISSNRVNFSVWGYSVSDQANPIADNPWIWSHELAQSIQEGRANRGDVLQHAKNLLEPTLQAFSTPCKFLFSSLHVH